MVEPETAILNAKCPECGHNWRPFGIARYYLPLTSKIKCPKCHITYEEEWYDSETKKKKLQQKLGLISNEELVSKITDLERKLSLLQQEVDIEKQKRELDQAELQKIKDWAKIREKDFREIEVLAEEENQRMTNGEDLK